MSLLEILDALLFKPLLMIFEFIWSLVSILTDSKGVAIIVLSLTINLLVLPLYLRADAMQEEERQMEKKLQKGVEHIKKTFRGDEQMMILRTYYKQNNYKPTYVFRSAASLFLELPFFIAAYRFLSGLTTLNGASFGPISDLSLPDGMLKIAYFPINILPFIMTAVNLISCILFTKDSPKKEKRQLYYMALFFLVALYLSPSGLVFYWTLNNIFSLVKTIIYKLKKPKKTPTVKVIKEKANVSAFLSGGVFLSMLMGVLIPSAVIKSSPQEFLISTLFYHPIWYIVCSFCIAFGLFVLWMGVFYWISSPSVRLVFDRFIWILSGIAIINYMFFNKNFGNLSASLKYENTFTYTISEKLLNLIIIIIAAIIFYIFYNLFKKRIHDILIIGIIAFVIMSASNISYINSSIKNIYDYGSIESSGFTLSRTGKNVVIIMLDRAMGEQVPFIFDERPELKEQFDGFTYYSNTISFSDCTNIAIPALLGGYEYTPIELNRRDDEPLEEKHNEALKVMPVLFDENGYEVTVINPVYANYQWIPDTTIYDDYPDISCYLDSSINHSSNTTLNLGFLENNKRNFFCYGMLKTMPWCIQNLIYDNGNYNQSIIIFNQNIVTDFTNTVKSSFSYNGQYASSALEAEGLDYNFMNRYAVLQNLPENTKIANADINTFLFISNDITHDPMLLQEPNYVPSARVNNTGYETSPLRRVLDGRILELEDTDQMKSYHTNMAALIQLGNWFDYLREANVYDNTRIILVSDHGRMLFSLEELNLNEDFCLSSFYPLLMVKDFGSNGFYTSDEFMTNADVPVLAMDGIIDNPINPFTGNIINSDEKTAHDQYIIDSDYRNTFNFNVNFNNGNTFNPTDWYSIHDNIWDKNNWTFIAEDDVLKSYD